MFRKVYKVCNCCGSIVENGKSPHDIKFRCSLCGADYDNEDDAIQCLSKGDTMPELICGEQYRIYGSFLLWKLTNKNYDMHTHNVSSIELYNHVGGHIRFTEFDKLIKQEFKEARWIDSKKEKRHLTKLAKMFGRE